MQADARRTQASYDTVAATYTQHFADELAHKSLERELLGAFAAQVTGRIADIGCGPGHITRFLRAAGREVVGVDLSPGMLAQASQSQPEALFVRADMHDLPFPDASFAGAVAFYSLIHIAPEEIPAVLSEIGRVLRPGGSLLCGFHQGAETQHRATWWDHPVDLDFHFFTIPQMSAWLTAAGYHLTQVTERQPHPDIEAQTQRAYILAQWQPVS